MDDIVKRIRAVKSMPELDALRIETVRAMMAGGGREFAAVQREFVKAKNRLRRIPLNKRSW